MNRFLFKKNIKMHLKEQACRGSEKIKHGDDILEEILVKLVFGDPRKEEKGEAAQSLSPIDELETNVELTKAT